MFTTQITKYDGGDAYQAGVRCRQCQYRFSVKPSFVASTKHLYDITCPMFDVRGTGTTK